MLGNRLLRAFVASSSTVALAATLAVGVGVGGAAAQEEPRFSDLDQTIHARAIELIADEGITTGFPDGTFRPRDDVRRDQMATFLTVALDLTRRPAEFSDVPANSVHFDAIGALAASGITTGFPDGTFRPRNTVTRGQMATFLAIGLELEPGSATFRDVPSSYVHADNIAALASAGITSGFPDGTFRPNAPVKRDQMAAFLAIGLGLPREDECPTPGGATTSSGSTAAASSTEEPAADADDETFAGAQVDSEDLFELRAGDHTARGADVSAAAAPPVAARQDLGHAVPGVAFPLTSVLRTSTGQIEVHSQDLADSRGARIDANGDVTATTTIPAGTRTWGATELGGQVYVGQFNTRGAANLYRYPVDAAAGTERRATAVTTVPTGNEFWDLVADGRGRLWTATRAHRDADVQRATGLGSNGLEDQRHVVHRVDRPGTAQASVTAVLFGVRCLPTTTAGQRPDVKQVATHGQTLYVGLGQQAAGARLYAFAPGDLTEVPEAAVRDLTPESVLSATSIFALEVNDDFVAIGTEGTASTAARLVVLDRRTEQVRADVALSGERRVDAIGIAGRRVVASTLTGRLYDLTVPTSGAPATRATRYDAPVRGQFSRYVEVSGDGLRGITSQGIVWTRSAAGEVEQVNLVDTGAPIDAGLPHSLHAGEADVAVGSTSAVSASAVTLRDRRELDPAPRTVSLQGEAKAMTSSPVEEPGPDGEPRGGDTFIASYPNAQLWRVPAGGDAAEPVQGWNGAFTRPADAAYDARTPGGQAPRVHVVAREEGNQLRENCTGCGDGVSRFFFRPSQLFSITPSQPGTGQVQGRPLRTGSGSPVEATSLAVGASPNGTEVYVGDTRGGVQRVNASNGAQQWYAEPTGDRRWRRVVAVEVVGDRLVVTTSGNLVIGGSNATRTIIDERALATGELLHSYEASRVFIAGDAVTSGDVTVLTRRNQLVFADRREESTEALTHASNDSWLGPYVALGADCDLYNLENVPSHLVRRAFEGGACAPEVDPPVDPGDPVDPVIPLP